MTITATFPIPSGLTPADAIHHTQTGPLADLLWDKGAVLTSAPEWHIDGNTIHVHATARRWDERRTAA